MPLEDMHELITGARREHFEGLRKRLVPRFLFRTWSASSGGGPTISTNTTTEIIPAAFVKEEGHSDFYSMIEFCIKDMATAHYRAAHEPLTEFSSWAASLHLVLCYAENKWRNGHENVHVAVIDRERLDGKVKLWHVPHLLKNYSAHEYLAHGIIKGKGYKAVRYVDVTARGVYKIFPEIVWAKKDWFGDEIRGRMFGEVLLGEVQTGKKRGKERGKKAKVVTADELIRIRKIAALFGELGLPIVVALLNLRPRPWGGENKRNITRSEMDGILKGLGGLVVGKGWDDELWLKERMVNTVNFPDVQQWIYMLRELIQYEKDNEVKEDGKAMNGTGAVEREDNVQKGSNDQVFQVEEDRRVKKPWTWVRKKLMVIC